MVTKLGVAAVATLNIFEITVSVDKSGVTTIRFNSPNALQEHF